MRKIAAPVTGAVLVMLLASGCLSSSASNKPGAPGSAQTTTAPLATTPPTAPAVTPTTAPAVTTTTAPAPPPTTTTTAPKTAPKPPAFKNLVLGSTGPAVLALQQRLTSLGYWLGTPDGVFSDSTQQAVYALQKAAGITRDGIVGPITEAAVKKGVLPHPSSKSGYVIEVDLKDDLMMFVMNGKLEYVLNTSTGGGYTYTDANGTSVAETPTGLFQIYRQVDGLVTDSLGSLWRPKFFQGGFAIHGDSYVPPEPVSHGCARVSDEAIDWIWADNIAPIGTAVWVY
jgi:Putative peptidoglycan binding domain/L,D-transpeptidase catalytic domain